MADAQHRLVGGGEIPLEPRRRVEIEVVGGLVEDVQVGRCGELPRERHAAALTTAQRTDAGRARHVGREPHSHENRIHLRRHLVAALALEPFEVTTVLLHRRFAVIGLELRRLLRQRGLELAQLAERVGDDVPQALIVGEAPVLVHERHTQPRRAGHRSARGRHVSRNEPHERRLARAVPPYDRPPVSSGDREGDVAKDFGGAEVDTGVAEGEKRHADRVMVWGPRRGLRMSAFDRMARRSAGSTALAPVGRQAAEVVGRAWVRLHHSEPPTPDSHPPPVDRRRRLTPLAVQPTPAPPPLPPAAPPAPPSPMCVRAPPAATP